MKKKITLLITVVLLLVGSVAIRAQEIIKVGATAVPHGEILEILVPVLAEQGIKLEIVEFTDYVRPNLALSDGDLDANFFQHLPYLEEFCLDHGLNLVSLAGVHVEPLGIYSSKIKSVDEFTKGSVVTIPNDATNGGRALLLLQNAGLIKINPNAGITPTIFDVTENKLNLKFYELEAAQLARSLDDTTASVINGNYALLAGFVPTKDAVFLEGAESPYVNILAVRAEDIENPLLAKLAAALQSDLVRDFILEKYAGSVVPAF